MLQEKQALLLLMMKDYVKLNPYAVFSYTNAACLYGTPRWDDLKLELHTVQLSKKFKNQHAITHIRPFFEKNEIDGLNVITLINLLLEISIYDSTLSAITSISYHLHMQDMSVDEIMAYCDSHKWKSGVAKLKHLATFASELDESPLETKVRLKLYDLGVITPMQQVSISCQNHKNYRVDFLFVFKNRKVILEADGLVKYSENQQARAAERQRESDLIREGYEIMRVINSDFEDGRFEQTIIDYAIPKRRYYGNKIVSTRY